LITEFKEDVEKWIVDWVSVYNENLKHIPCPFAKKAMLDGQIEWSFVESIEELKALLQEAYFDKEVWMIGFDPEKIEAGGLSEEVHRFNSDYMPKGIIALEDHPHDKEVILGERMNQGKWGWVGVQRLAKIDRASQQLARTGYYDLWPEETYADVVAWRHDEKLRKVESR
jgi:hypothetical protein